MKAWVDAFNRMDVDALTSFYHEGAINHQVAEEPVEGRDAIRVMFAAAFATATMVCLVENLFEDGEWAILEWRDPTGLRGCGFFHVVDGRIAFRRRPGRLRAHIRGPRRRRRHRHRGSGAGGRRQLQYRDDRPFHSASRNRRLGE